MPSHSRDVSLGLPSQDDRHRWKKQVEGSGSLQRVGDLLRFVNLGTSAREYSNAQIDDYQGLPRRAFPWKPPLRLTVRARFSHPAGTLRGTAGFGFWNDPLLMTEHRLPMLPRALWFFYASPPSDMRLGAGVPGHGWKVATIDALRPIAFLLAPLALPAALLMNVKSVYRALWPRIQRALKIEELILDLDMTAWHTYVIEWGEAHSQFLVDGRPVLEQALSPRGPLGFVVWLDNQYMIVTPWGRFGWGFLETRGRQWLEVERMSIDCI